MRKTMIAAALAASSLAVSAQALTLVSATVRGQAAGVNSGTVWTAGDPAGTSTSNYTLFLQTPGLGDFVNPNDEAINLSLLSQINRVLLAGDGYPTNTTLDSDSMYELTLGFDGGQTLDGVYTPTTNTFLGGTNSFVDNGTTYTLSEFSFRRFLGNPVGPFRAEPGTGDGNDYVGNFVITTAGVAGAVPEPMSWALLVGGFGFAGAAARRHRRQQVRVAFA